MRAVRGVYTADSAMTALIAEGPSAAAIAMASRMAGNAISASISRISGPSNCLKIAGHHADQRTGDTGHQGHGEADRKRQAGAVHQAAPDVAAVVVGAERVGDVGGAKAQPHLHLLRRQDLDEIRRQRQHQHRAQQDGAGHEEAVTAQAPPQAGWPRRRQVRLAAAATLQERPYFTRGSTTA